MDQVSIVMKKIEFRTNMCALAGSMPIFDWEIVYGTRALEQRAFHIRVKDKDKILWDSGPKNTPVQRVTYQGTYLRPGKEYEWELIIWTENSKAAYAQGKFSPEI